MNAMPNFSLFSFFATSFLPSFFADVPFFDAVFLVETCSGVDCSSLSSEFNSDRSPPPLFSPPCPAYSCLLSLSLPGCLLRFFDCPPLLLFPSAIISSNEEVDESSSSAGGRVNRSNISGGNTAPKDKILFPPLLAVRDLVGFGGGGVGAGTTADSLRVAEAAVGRFAFAASDADDEDDDEESSLPYPFNRSIFASRCFVVFNILL
mmetsp:Transcript_8253/g.20296  ORF Transcript_8253/g.20296 Transcript_8253/m.20296 type:complete len:206 (+) Transcript_8253:1022-1639(+)